MMATVHLNHGISVQFQVVVQQIQDPSNVQLLPYNSPLLTREVPGLEGVLRGPHVDALVVVDQRLLESGNIFHRSK